jgi:hypothetical protein
MYGIGLGKFAENLTGGMVQGMTNAATLELMRQKQDLEKQKVIADTDYKNKHLELLKTHYDSLTEDNKQKARIGAIDTVSKMLKVGGPQAAKNVANTLFPTVGLEPLADIQPTEDPGTWHIITSGGKHFRANPDKGVVEPLTLSGGQPLPTTPDPWDVNLTDPKTGVSKSAYIDKNTMQPMTIPAVPPGGTMVPSSQATAIQTSPPAGGWGMGGNQTATAPVQKPDSPFVQGMRGLSQGMAPAATGAPVNPMMPPVGTPAPESPGSMIIPKVKEEKDTGTTLDMRFDDIRMRQATGKPVPPEDLAFVNSYLERKNSSAVARTEGWSDIKQENVVDTKDNNTPKYVSITELNRAAKDEPGRYVPTAAAEKAMKQTALLEDIRGNLQNTRNSISKLKTDFDEKTRLKLYQAVQSTDPSGSINNLITGEFGKSLTSEQQQYLVDVTNLIENSMAMRTLLGGGQSSDDMRKAIRNTIPGTGTFSKDYANKQLDRFEQVLNRLSRGVTNVPLRNVPGVGGGSELPADTVTINGKSMSMSDAVKSMRIDPENPGKSLNDAYSDEQLVSWLRAKYGPK